MFIIFILKSIYQARHIGKWVVQIGSEITEMEIKMCNTTYADDIINDVIWRG